MDEAPTPPRSQSEETLQVLLIHARDGSPTALSQLRRLLDEHPVIWHQAGDLAARAEAAWVELAAGDDLLMRESLIRQVAGLKAELLGSSPSPMERLLVERVCACWLQTQYADAAAASARDLSARQAEFALKHQDRAHRRYMSAVAALNTYRKLQPASERVRAEPAEQPPEPLVVFPPPHPDDPAGRSLQARRVEQSPDAGADIAVAVPADPLRPMTRSSAAS